MSSINPAASKARRSSIFDLDEFKRPAPMGSSMMSFAYEPHGEDGFGKPPQQVQYENTYRMEPEVKFEPGKVTAIIQEILDEGLKDQKYHPVECAILCKDLSQHMKWKVKELNYKRYKIVCLVTIIDKHDQGCRIGSRCVWDVDRDSFASANFENSHLYAVGSVYALYYE